MDGHSWTELGRLRDEQVALTHRLAGAIIHGDLPEQGRLHAKIEEIEQQRDKLLREMAENLV